MSKSQLCREYRTKYGMEMPTKTLARIMYKEHPLFFTNLEDARVGLRVIEGKSGAKLRKDTANKEMYLEGSVLVIRMPFRRVKKRNIFHTS